MESIDDEEFLAGLAPPTIKATANNSLRRNSDDALPKTPPLAATPGSVLGRKPVSDATSTLLNFLKQEQAIVADQRPQLATSQLQQEAKELPTAAHVDQLLSVTSRVSSGPAKAGRNNCDDPAPAAASSQLGSAANICSSSPPAPPPPLPAGTAASHTQMVSNSHQGSAAAAAAPSAVIPAPAFAEGPPAGRVSAIRQQLEAGVPGTVLAASGRRAASNGAAQHPAPVASAKPAAKQFDSWDLDDDMLPDGSGKSAGTGGHDVGTEDIDETKNSSYMPSFVSSKNSSNRSRTSSSAAAPSPISAATGTSHDAAAAGGSVSSGPGDMPPTSTTVFKQPVPHTENEKQQIASQMAAALARRAQLNQQPVLPAAAGSNGSSSSSPAGFHSSAARTVGSPVQTASDTSSGIFLYGSPPTAMSGKLATSSKVEPPVSAAGVFSVIGNPAYSPPVSPQGNTATTSDSTTTSPGASRGLVIGAGGLLARGLTDLGIADSPPPATAGQQQSSEASGAYAVPEVRPAAAAVHLQLHAVSSGLPPGVTPMTGRSGAATFAALPNRPEAAPAASGSSAATAVAMISTLTSSSHGHSTAQEVSQVQEGQQQQLPLLRPAQPQHQQQQLVQQNLPLQQQQHGKQLPLEMPQSQAAPVAQPGRPCGCDTDSQMSAVRQLAGLQQQLAHQKLTMARWRQQTDDEHCRHQSEVARLHGDLEAATQKAAADAAAARENLIKEIAAAEARAQRAACLERDVACAQLKAQAAAIAQEREVLASHMINADVLTSLSEKVRDAAAATAERESRALAALEQGTAERSAALVARERRLQEREAAVSARERELDELKCQLSKVLAGLEDQAAADKQFMEAHTARLARESARLEALQAALLSEREEAKLAVSLEKQALEDARAVRVKEREELVTEMTAERRRLATEAACTARSAEEARANLLDLKGRVADYEASAAAALRQTREEEARAAAVRTALRGEQEKLLAAQKELKAAGCKLDDDRSQLQEWGARLAVLTREFDAAKDEVKSARTEIQTQRTTLTSQVAALIAAQDQLELQRQRLLDARVDLDRQRVLIAQQRAALSQDRIAASAAAATGAAAVPNSQCAVLSPNLYQPHRPQSSPAVGGSRVVVEGGAGAERQPRSSSAGRKSSVIGRNTLRRLMEELQLDELSDQGGTGSNRSKRLSHTVKAQRDFLGQLQVASTTNSRGGALVALDISRSLAGRTVSDHGMFGGAGGAAGAGMLPYGSCAADSQAASRKRHPSEPSKLAAVGGQGKLLSAATGQAKQISLAIKQPAETSQQEVLLLLQQLARSRQAAESQLGTSQSDAAVRMLRHDSKQQQNQQVLASELLQLHRFDRSSKGQQRHRKQKHCAASRVSSDLSQMIALSVSGSEEVEAEVDRACDRFEGTEWQQHASGGRTGAEQEDVA